MAKKLTIGNNEIIVPSKEDISGQINTAITDKVDANSTITGATKAKITYDSKGLVTAGTDLIESDIPTLPASKITQDTSNRFVSDTEKSTWNGKITANAAITAATKTKITYDAKGLVTAGGDLVEADIPNLSAGKITSGEFGTSLIPALPTSKITGLDTALSNKVTKNVDVIGATKAKITYDAKGLVTGGTDLVETDIPSLNASKITEGEFTTTLIPALPTSKITGLDTALGSKVDKNTVITGATKTKITYDSKGLVTAGTDLIESDIPSLPASKITQDTSNRFVSDTEKSTWTNKQDALGFVPEAVVNKKTVLNNSDTEYPSSKAVITAIATASAQTYKPMGNWNASTNTPTLTNNDSARANEVWYVSTAGSQFGISFGVGDELVYTVSGVIFKRDNVNAVLSVNTKTGAVTLNQDDVSDGTTYKRVTQTEKNTWNAKVDSNAAITAATKTKITYDAKGLVTAGADLTASDIPALATSKITGLDTALSNKLDKNTVITGATKTKITYDSKGLVTAGGDLTASDIPALPASKITAGTEGYILTVVSGVASWATPGASSNNFLTGVSGSGNGVVTFTRQGLTDLTWDASHTHAASEVSSGTFDVARIPNLDWAKITSGKPTTLSGYGITDALSTAGGTLTNRLIIDYSATGGDGTWDKSGILIKNNNATLAETAVAMQTAATGTDLWIQGLNQSSDYKWAYGNAFTDGNVKMVLTAAGGLSVMGQSVVLTNDARLSDARPASDVSAWAKAETKPTYTAAEVGALASTHAASGVTSGKITNWDAAYSHSGLTTNPHGVTKAQVGLTNVEDKSSATIRSEITSLNVTTALGFTPYNATNPSNYISGITSGMVTGALGFTPYNATNPSNYISGIDSSMVTTALGFTPYDATNPSNYISGITSGMVTTALGFTPYDATNPSNYISAVPNDHVTNARLANMAVSTIKGRVSAGTGDPEDLTVAQVQTLLGLGSAAYTASTAYRDSSWVPSWTDVTGKPSTFTPSSHTHGSVTNDGKIGSTANLVVMTGTGGALTAKAAGSAGQFLAYDGSWATPPNTTYGAMSSTVLGLGKLFSDTVQSVAATAVSATASRTYGIQANGSGQLVVNVPWTDNNTTYSEISEAEIDSNSSSTVRLITGRRFHYGLRNVQTVSTTLDLGVGATASGNTKTINIGTGGVAGSNTLINLGSSLSTVTIAGNLVFTGTATSINTTSLQVSDYIIEIAKDNTVALTGYAGFVIPKYDGTNAGGIIIDSDGEFRIGDVSYVGNTITDVGSQPLLTRAEKASLVNNDIFVWDSTDSRAIGKTISELNIQPYDADLTAIAALGFTATAFLKKTAADTWALDTNTYLTANQTITLTGDITGSGTTSIATTIGAGKVTNTMLAGSIAISKLVSSTISGVSLGSNLAALTIGSGLSGTSYNGSAAITIEHSNSITAGNFGDTGATRTLGFGGTFVVPYVTYDANGHITSKSNLTLTMPANPNTDTNWYPTAFAWTGGTTAGPTGSLTGVGMSAVAYGAIPSASGTASGIVTTGAQTFAGAKQFNDTITVRKDSSTTNGLALTNNTNGWTWIGMVAGGTSVAAAANVVHLAWKNQTEGAAPANSYHIRPGGSTTSLSVDAAATHVYAADGLKIHKDATSSEGASMKYDSTSKSLKFIFAA